MNEPRPQPFDHRVPQGYERGSFRGPMGVRPFVVGLNPQLILPDDTRRGYLLVQNNSGANMIVGIGAPATTGEGLVLASGVYWEPIYVPTNGIYICSATLAAARGVALFISL